MTDSSAMLRESKECSKLVRSQPLTEYSYDDSVRILKEGEVIGKIDVIEYQ